MLKARMLFAVCLLLSAPLAIQAADAGALFDKLDTNKDGAISREEFVSCPLVRSTDSSSKDRIQHRDLCVKPGSALSVAEKQRLFDKVDLDKSGSISRKELYKFATPDGFAPIRF